MSVGSQVGLADLKGLFQPNSGILLWTPTVETLPASEKSGWAIPQLPREKSHS